MPTIDFHGVINKIRYTLEVDNHPSAYIGYISGTFAVHVTLETGNIESFQILFNRIDQLLTRVSSWDKPCKMCVISGFSSSTLRAERIEFF